MKAQAITRDQREITAGSAGLTLAAGPIRTGPLLPDRRVVRRRSIGVARSGGTAHPHRDRLLLYNVPAPIARDGRIERIPSTRPPSSAPTRAGSRSAGRR